MSETLELRKMVEKIITEMTSGKVDLDKTVNPYKSGDDGKSYSVNDGESGEFIPDIMSIDLKAQYLVENAANKDAFLALKTKTPARLGIGRAGARYKTITALRVRADHAAAQDSVFSEVPKEFVEENGYVYLKSTCESKDEYLTRPDKGRRLDSENLQKAKAAVGTKPKVVLVVGDGLSPKAILANAPKTVPAIKQSLKMKGIEIDEVLYVQYCRVAAGDAIGDVTECDVVCVLIGERPGLVTAESMSAYITYAPKTGISESKRTVISNIHDGGTPALEAGAQAGEIIMKMLEQKASGLDLRL